MKSKYSILIICLLLLGFAYKSASQKQYYERALSAQQSKVTLWRDRQGRSRAKIQTLELELETVADVYESEIDSLKKDFDFRVRNLDNVTNISTSTSETVYLTQIDTVYYPHYVYQDKWTYIELKFKTEQPELFYSIKDSVSFIQHYKRENLLGKKVLYIDGISHNPNTQITGMKNLRVNKSPNNFSLGLQLGYSPSGMYLGLGLNYAILKW